MERSHAAKWYDCERKVLQIMYRYKLWIRINEYQTAHTYVWADHDYEAKLLGEAQYGVGNVLNYTREDQTLGFGLLLALTTLDFVAVVD